MIVVRWFVEIPVNFNVDCKLGPGQMYFFEGIGFNVITLFELESFVTNSNQVPFYYSF